MVVHNSQLENVGKDSPIRTKVADSQDRRDRICLTLEHRIEVDICNSNVLYQYRELHVEMENNTDIYLFH